MHFFGQKNAILRTRYLPSPPQVAPWDPPEALRGSQYSHMYKKGPIVRLADYGSTRVNGAPIL